MTGAATPLRFRPTVVVCLGDAGREVGVQLLPLLRSLDSARRAGVAVLAVRDADGGVLAGDWLDAPDGYETLASDRHAFSVGLESLVVEAFRGQEPARVQADERRHGVLEDPIIWRIQDDGASVPRPLAVVWIVAAADAPELAAAAAAVRRAAITEHVECWTLLALTNVYPQDAAAHVEQAARCADQPWRQLLVGTDGAVSPATCAYLFESHGEHGTFWERPGDVAYATAEAIFVLTATGITTTREYEETLRRNTPGMVREPTERIASTGASRLSFPRGPAEQYCASVLGAAVLRAWEPPDLDDDSYAAEREAEALDWLASVARMTRPDPARRRGGRASPRLSALGVRDALGLARPDPDGGLMFAHLRTELLQRLMAGRPERLPAVVDEQYAVADRGYTTWQEAIRPRWERFEDDVQRELVAEVNDLALSGATGLGRALGYARALHAVLDDERARQQTANTRRREAYDRFLEDLALSGTYIPSTHRGTTSGHTSGGSAHTPNGSAVPSPMSVTNPLEARENDVARGLAARYLDALAQVPPPLAIAGAVLATVPPAVFVLQSLLGTSPLLLTALLAVIFTLLGAGLVLLRRHTLMRAADDLRALYRRRLAVRCEEHEHLRRLAVIAALRYRVTGMLTRLQAWERFIADLAGELERDAALAEHTLFEGPASRRDLFVANRQRLRRDGYTLRAFERDVSRVRTRAPVEGAPWHRSNDLLLRRLLAALHGRVDVVTGDLGALKRPVRDFCLGVVQPYLHGDLVSLAAALDAMSGKTAAGLVDTLVERAVILYRPLDPPRPASLFAASRDDLHPLIAQAGRARDAHALEIPDDEWLAMLRLAPAGARPSFWPLPRPRTATATAAHQAAADQGRGG